ncbi:MerR family transcriptional regulator [Ruminiclostridium cellobioparum]|uniref:MerR family transcriptional regulator n=1 Tax=Ruminiclostridium cellobioparum TaxID=29355 RepID=UPI0004869EE9|nr:MerR family transcriptional regulator [Ruminiclostridium cellobioparum]
MMAALIKISDVSKKYNITKRTLRFYEEIGLLKSIKDEASHARYYDEEGINRLEQILLLRNIKLTMNEISRVLLSDNGRQLSHILLSRLDEIENKIYELKYSKSIIQSVLKMSEDIGISNVNIYQFLREQILLHSTDERMISMEKSYKGDTVRLEFGTGIIPYINTIGQENFIDLFKGMRKKLELELKKGIPLIRLVDNEGLDEFQIRISVKDNVLIDTNLQAISDEDKLKEMVHYLEGIVRANIDEIS